MVSLKHAQTVTPTPGPAWRKMSDAQRLARVEAALRAEKAAFNGLAVTAARPNGEVIVTLAGSISIPKRGPLLLDFEASLKKAIDPGLAVWLEPLGDRNSLRNLRGIEVKE